MKNDPGVGVLVFVVSELNLAAAALDTATDSLSAPVVVIPPSVATMFAVSALYNIIANDDATPLEKVTLVPVPKFVLETVGTFESGEFDAPEKVIVFPPVYPNAVFLYGSFAVTVMFCELPAVCVPAPVTTNNDAAAGATSTLSLSDPAALILPFVTATSIVSSV